MQQRWINLGRLQNIVGNAGVFFLGASMVESIINTGEPRVFFLTAMLGLGVLCILFATLEMRKMSMLLPIMIGAGIVLFFMVLFTIGLMQERDDTVADDKPAAPDSTSSE